MEVDALVDEARVHVVRGERVLDGAPGELVTLARAERPGRGRDDGRARVSASRRDARGRVEPRRLERLRRGRRRASRSSAASFSRSGPGEAQVTRCHKALCALALGRRARRSRAAVGGDETPTEVVLVTHDSFAISEDVKQAFEERERPDAADSQGRRRRRDRHAGAADGREPARATCSSASTTTCSRARSRATSSRRTSRRSWRTSIRSSCSTPSTA